MAQPFETRIRQIMSGQSRGIGAGLARAALACVEPIYTAIVGARNRLFERNLVRIDRLPRPVISVGNLTTGGTGKTPVVQWIVRELQALSYQPAVLMRGYKRADATSISDEQQMLVDSLKVPVFADPKRFLAGQRALQAHPNTDVFVLDDGFQHRQLARDLDIVLIDATNPFGYDHVLPRGMLRESMAGLARVDAVILTRVDLAPPDALGSIESAIRAANRHVPILRSVHRMDEVSGDGVRETLDRLHGKRVWAFCGIGNPQGFENGLLKAGVEVAGFTVFGDHHAYGPEDLESLQAEAAKARATVLLTTEKDSVKLRELSGLISSTLPVWTIGVRIEMNADDSERLRGLLKNVMTTHAT